MKRKISLVLLLVITIFVGWFFLACPDYVTMYDNKTMTEESNEVKLYASIHKFWDVDKIARNIMEEHVRVNGKSDSITINIYITKMFYIKGYEPYKIIKYM